MSSFNQTVISPTLYRLQSSSPNLSQTISSSPSVQNTTQIKQPTIEFKPIILTEWQQCDLNNEAERMHFTATYYRTKGNKLLMIGTCLQFTMLLLSLSGSYISSFTSMNDFEKSILMSVMQLSTAIMSGVYTFFSFTKKGQSYKEASSILFQKIEKIKLVITTMKSDKEYEEMKASLIEALLKYDIETIREKYNDKNYIHVYKDELESNLVRNIKYGEKGEKYIEIVSIKDKNVLNSPPINVSYEINKEINTNLSNTNLEEL
jgi:hypothetical protein